MKILLAIVFASLLASCGGGETQAPSANVPLPFRLASPVSGDTETVLHLYQALYGKAPSNPQLVTFKSQIAANGAVSWVNATAAEFNSLSNRAFAERVLNNISITPTSLTATPTFGTSLQAYNALLGGFADYLSLVGVGNRGVVAAQLAKIISNLEIDTQFGVYGQVAVSLNRQITLNSAYSADPKNIVDGVVPNDTGTVIANFDTILATDVPDTNGGTGSISAAPPAGGSGSAYALLRSGGQVYALGLLNVKVPFTATRKTLSARVYSPTAGIPIVLKVEKLGTNGSVTTGDTPANETVVVGWQILTWTFNSVNPANTYDLLVLLPRLSTVDAPPGKTYYFDDITLLPAAVAPPPAGTDTVIANFDTILATDVPDINGGTGTITATPPAGGSGSAYALLRSGGQVYALGLLNVTVPFTATRKTLSARVYSPTAGIPIVLKVEKLGTNGSITTGDTQANETVVVGWQTLTWTFNSVNPANTYDLLVLLPRLGTVDAPPGKTYYFDDIKLLAAGGSTPVLEMGAAGPQTLTIAAGDVKTRDGGNTMFVAGEGIFALNYVGSAETQAPFNLAAWPDAKSANFTGVTGVAGGSIGYFQDDVNLSASPQKIDEGGWVAGTAISPDGVPNFFRYFVLKGAVSTNAYMGLYANAPNNGTVNTSSFSKIKLKVWGPGPMFDRTNFTPILEITLTGPKVAGCTTGSGGTEITQNLSANLRNGAGGAYTLPFAGFTVKGLCGTDTAANAVANVRANLARVVVTVPGTSFNYTNLEGGNYATGINLGPIGFTNN